MTNDTPSYRGAHPEDNPSVCVFISVHEGNVLAVCDTAAAIERVGLELVTKGIEFYMNFSKVQS